MRHLQLTRFAFAAAASLAAFSAHAQTAAPAAPGSTGSITRDQLRACMNTADELKAKSAALDQRQGVNREEHAAIRAEAADLGEEQKRVEGNQMRMDRFNRKVAAHNARLDKANAGLQALRAEQEALNAAVGAYNTGCVNKSVNVDDRDAVMKERAEKK